MRAERALTLSLILAFGWPPALTLGQPAGAASPASPVKPGALVTKLPVARNAASVLPVEQAFSLTAVVLPASKVGLEWRIQPGYYLYQQKVAVIAADGRKIALDFPAAILLHDEFEGESRVYYDSLTLQFPLPAPAADGKHHLTVQFQGCAQDRYCYPPVQREIALEAAQ